MPYGLLPGENVRILTFKLKSPLVALAELEELEGNAFKCSENVQYTLPTGCYSCTSVPIKSHCNGTGTGTATGMTPAPRLRRSSSRRQA